MQHWFINTKTLEKFDKALTFAEATSFVQENKDIEFYYEWKANNDPAVLTFNPYTNDLRHTFEKKGPAPTFNKMLKSIKKVHKGSTINTWGSQ